MMIKLTEKEKNTLLIGRQCEKLKKGALKYALLIGCRQQGRGTRQLTPDIARELVKNVISIDGVNSFSIEIERYTMCVILFDNNRQECVDGILNSLDSYFRSKRQMWFTDGQIFSDLENIRHNINRLIRQYEDVGGRGIVCECGLMVCVHEQEHSTMVASSTIESLVHTFIAGRFDELEEQIDEITEYIRNTDIYHTTGSEPTSIKRFFLELSAYSYHTMYDSGVNIDRILDYEDPYKIIFGLDETPKIKEWYMDSCRKLYAEYKRMQSEKKSVLAGDIQAFITDNIHDENLSVNQIADSLNLSPAYISSCYSRETGNTIIGYIIEKRLDKAKELLEGTNLTVGEISREVGYYSERYFYSAFKKGTGVTPSQYRKKQHKIQKK